MTECVKAAVEQGEGNLEEANARDYCQCTYDDIEANVPFDEFAEFDAAVTENEDATPPPEVVAAARRCAPRLTGG
jgi:hypothetical protein